MSSGVPEKQSRGCKSRPSTEIHMKHKNTDATHADRKQDPNTVEPRSKQTGNDFPEWNEIWSYSRAEALADEVLIDVSELAREAGFRYPVALTATAWQDCVLVSSTDHVHDETGRLGDVLNVLRYVVRMNPGRSEVRFCVDIADENEHVTRVWLKCQCGFGDSPEPVLTVMVTVHGSVSSGRSVLLWRLASTASESD